TEIVEIGAGKTLSGLARRIDRSLSAQAVNGPDDVVKLAKGDA
ncbi:MAG: malonyl CoA-acyl carrier protein transacylase, partial [Pseudomonadota bacterium]